MPIAPIRTNRLTLSVFTADAIDAMLAGDALRLNAITAAAFPQPLSAPPLMEDMLPNVRDRMRSDPAQEGWWAWVVVRRDTGQAVGCVGLGGPPNEEGTVVMGYATYPGAEGHGFATEAAEGLLDGDHVAGDRLEDVGEGRVDGAEGTHRRHSLPGRRRAAQGGAVSPSPQAP